MFRKLFVSAVLAFLATGALARTVLIDVRTPEEYAAGHLEGALNIDHQVIAQRVGMAGVGKEDEVQVYCRSGRRSAIAAQNLKSLGYTRVIDLGSMDAARTRLCSVKGSKSC